MAKERSHDPTAAAGERGVQKASRVCFFFLFVFVSFKKKKDLEECYLRRAERLFTEYININIYIYVYVVYIYTYMNYKCFKI